MFYLRIVILLIIAPLLVHAEKLPCGTSYTFFEKTHPQLTGKSLSELDHDLANHIAQKKLGKIKIGGNGTIRIPVVFHLIHRSFVPVGMEENYSDIVLYDILKNMNDAFCKTPGTYWDGDGADAEIEFCLASIDPQGKPTNGIIRINGSVMPRFDSVGVYFNGVASPASADLIKLSWWDNKSYVNIYIVHEIVGAGGFANGNSVVISAVNDIVDMNYNTYIHELGHYFSLYHIFEDTCSETDCATQGDRLCDTPPTEPGNIGPGYCQGAPTCGTDQISLVRNYMDYGLIKCHNMFTQGQVDRMRASLDTTRISDNRSILSTTGNLIKTGCFGNALPLSLFVPDRSMACIEDTVMFRNYSRNASSFLWNFENGRPATSNEKEPRVVFFKTGENKVTLTATNKNGTHITDTRFHVEGTAPPVVQGSLLDADSQHTLTATSPYNLNWYENDTSSIVLGTASQFVTPVLPRSKSYFVQAYGAGLEHSVGMPENKFPLSGSNDGNVYFTVYKTLLIKSVKVFAKQDRFKFHLRDQNAIILKEFTIDGEKIPYGQMIIELNIQLSPGAYYFDYYYNDDPENFWISGLGIDTEGGNFPYTVPGLLSIDSTDRPANYYYHYYDWKVQEILCRSERVMVTASVKGDLSVQPESSTGCCSSLNVHMQCSQNILSLSFNLPNPSLLSIAIFDVSGSLVKRIEKKKVDAGFTVYTLDVAGLASGSYIVEMKTGLKRFVSPFLKR